MQLRDYQIPRKYDSGIVIHGDPGMVPEYECREAAIYCNYNYSVFLELESVERAKSVALYREHHRVEANMNHAAEVSSKNRSNNQS